MIEIADLTKNYRTTTAVDLVSFTAPAGAVTGFLGPNGAGKTTTLRVLLGLSRPDTGTALINGARYADLPRPRREVGAVLDQTGFHPGRTGRDQLRIVARGAGVPAARVDEVLGYVDLAGAAGRRVGGYSQGMRQRLALAGALLGDPGVLILDEPATGLDPAGIAWLRARMRAWASQGRTVLFSSHVLAEVEAVADRVVIIDRGRIIREGATVDLTGGADRVVVRTTERDRLAAAAEAAGWVVRRDGAERLVIGGATPDEVGRLAAAGGFALAELARETTGRQLEDVFLELTGGVVGP
jgi:ABC-2 type transport system ATP-binding protein